MSTCSQAEALRDYAFDELAAGDRRAMEQHIAGCPDCAGELDQLRVTTAALRSLPDCEIPRRIAFVSDKVFSPSPVARFFNGLWNSTARLGFLSACAIAVALIVSAYHRPAEIRIDANITKQVNDAVTRAVAQVRIEDAQSTKVLLETINRDHQREHQALMEAVTVFQERANTNILLASHENRRGGSGQ
jgi:anti-sigma factor RsiW